MFAKSASASADCGHLRSHSGQSAGCVLVGLPTAPEYAVESLEFRILVLEQLLLPLVMAVAQCEGCSRQQTQWPVATPHAPTQEE